MSAYIGGQTLEPDADRGIGVNVHLYPGANLGASKSPFLVASKFLTVC